MIEYGEVNPFFKICKGEKVPMSIIKSSIPFFKPSVDTLLVEGKLMGQYTLDGDLILWMREKVV